MYKGRRIEPFLFVPGEFTTRSGITWMLSFGGQDSKQLSGLVMTEHLTNGRSISRFAYPKSGRAKLTLTPKMMPEGTDVVVLDHLFSNDLMQSSAARVDPL